MLQKHNFPDRKKKHNIQHSYNIQHDYYNGSKVKITAAMLYLIHYQNT